MYDFASRRGATARRLARAVLEGIAYQVTDVIGGMVEDSGVPIGEQLKQALVKTLTLSLTLTQALLKP